MQAALFLPLGEVSASLQPQTAERLSLLQPRVFVLTLSCAESVTVLWEHDQSNAQALSLLHLYFNCNAHTARWCP